jgi:hypothetical protein
MNIEQLVKLIKETNTAGLRLRVTDEMRQAIACNPSRVHIEREWCDYVAIGAQSYAPFKRTTTLNTDNDYEGAILSAQMMDA